MTAVPTPPFRPALCVMVVQADEPLADLVKTIFTPLPLLRVGHPSAAFERMLITHPVCVVLARRPPPDLLERVTDGAVSVGAELIIADDFDDHTQLRERLAMALVAARRRRRRTGAAS